MKLESSIPILSIIYYCDLVAFVLKWLNDLIRYPH
jgi:hypothetical protein